jgi:hypothetical protein
VVRTLEAHDAACVGVDGRVDDGRAPVATNVVERTQDVVTTAHHDDALATDIEERVRASSAEVGDAPGAQPAACKPVVTLKCKDLRVVEDARRQEVRLVNRLARRTQLNRRRDACWLGFHVSQRTTSAPAGAQSGVVWRGSADRWSRLNRPDRWIDVTGGET